MNDSEQAFEALFHLYADRILRYVQLFVKSREATEELTEDIFIVVWTQREKIMDVQDFNAWIYGVARFKALKLLRIHQPEYLSIDDVPIDLFASTQTTPEDDCISKEMAMTANRAIERLSPKVKMAFKLVREDGMKYKEAAEHLGISVKTLETHIAAATKAIAKAIRRE
ncbi:MAG: RNA polymerase sigma factor [Tannerellaceae bacterium]|nr:RNA polymerase sigma factor [Tannerellaceae bacterium]